MKNLGFILAATALMAAWSLPAQAQSTRTIVASKKYITKPVATSIPFESIELSSIVDVDFTQSTDGQTQMSVYGSDNLVNLVELTNSNGRLIVGFSRKVHVRGERRLKLIVTAPTLRSVQITGTGDFDAKGALKTGDFALRISGTGDIQIRQMQCGDVSASISGTGDLELGLTECRGFSSDQSGTGDITIKSIVCTNLSATTTGTGDFEATLASQADVTVRSSSTGDITLAGKAATARLTSTGTGKIDARDLWAKSVTAATSGTGDITCQATEKLNASANGTGTIRYYGQPASVEKSGQTKRIEQH